MKQSPILLVGAVLLLGSLAPAHAATMVLHNFNGGVSDGAEPVASLTLSGSKLYGMTKSGGRGSGNEGEGVIFSLNRDGTGFGLLHTFNLLSGTGDGLIPLGSLTLFGSKLYGMTSRGGSSGVGTIFSLNTDGTGYTLLRNFAGGISDGRFPQGSLTLSGSKLYGMTRGGGSGDRGVVFSMNADGTGFSLLHTFTGSISDGSNPRGSLTISGSTIYGITTTTGSSALVPGGVIFRMNTDGTGYSLLHTFGGLGDGAFPEGSLTLSGSKLYGMTAFGGSNNTGTLFSLNTDGTGYSLLHTFAGGVSDGANPFGSLMISDSTLYGMTTYGGSTAVGGSSGFGTLFSIGVDGTGFSVLESFYDTAEGAYPDHDDLTLSADGSMLYGMTKKGGTANQGVIFSRAIVPEPGASVLLAFGTLLLSARRRNARA